ncbi:MAG TPA: AbrB/MazE/SpoVT family DNA-binding domain-containing protein [Thermoanaerobaculia bacterium]|nr:AbrB/MazE/SpoVT family DNA-binding domain-containing protein [Thermoanaerobaculia bacterium]
MAIATVTSKGQITLPKEVREHLHLSEGDRVEFVIEEGRVQVRSLAGSVRSLFGCLRDARRVGPSLEELEERLLDSLAEDNERIRRGGE